MGSFALEEARERESHPSVGYRLNGNRTNTGYSTGDNNQLLSDGTHDYEYDDEGNRIKRTDTATGDYVEYEWDHRNRLVKVSFYDDQDTLQKQIEYRYDAFDRRIAKLLDSDGNQTVDAEDHFVYDGSDTVLQYDDAGSLTHRYLHGPAVDQILADEDDIGDVLWPLADNQGTVGDLVDDNGDVQNHLTYDAFGNITSETDDTVEHLFAYTGREWDPDAELYYHGARWYDPHAGRWLSEDWIDDDVNNTYRYVGNSPTNWVDPDGLEAAAPYTRGYWGDVGQVIIGYGDAAVGTAKGAWFVVRHPIQTAKGVGTSIRHPIQTFNAVCEDVKDKSQTLRGQGELVGDVLIGVATGGTVKAVGKAGKIGIRPGLPGGKPKPPGALPPGPKPPSWQFGINKPISRWESQMARRGWTPSQIAEAIQHGKRFPATNLVNKGNPATRCVHPKTGQSVVIDDITGEVIHIGGPGFKY